jgi:DNA-binding HxlR family transcriptional regulator
MRGMSRSRRIEHPGRRSNCPLACALDLVGDRWTLLVIRDLSRGLTRFEAFLESPERIASNILSQRLRSLVEQGFAERIPDPDDRRRAHYRLTPRGQRLGGLVDAVVQWGLREVAGTTTDFDRVPLTKC